MVLQRMYHSFICLIPGRIQQQLRFYIQARMFCIFEDSYAQPAGSEIPNSTWFHLQVEFVFESMAHCRGISEIPMQNAVEFLKFHGEVPWSQHKISLASGIKWNLEPQIRQVGH